MESSKQYAYEIQQVVSGSYDRLRLKIIHLLSLRLHTEEEARYVNLLP